MTGTLEVSERSQYFNLSFSLRREVDSERAVNSLQAPPSGRTSFHHSSKTIQSTQISVRILFVLYFMSEIKDSKLILKLHPWGKIRMPDLLATRKSLRYLSPERSLGVIVEPSLCQVSLCKNFLAKKGCKGNLLNS